MRDWNDLSKDSIAHERGIIESTSQLSDNAFEADKAGTNARSFAESRIEELRGQGGVFVEAVRATRMPMVVTDPSLPGNPIVFANASFLELSGYAMDEVLGQQPYFMNGEETDEADTGLFREAIEQDRDAMIETVQYRKDRSRFIASVFLSGFKDNEGRTVHQFLSYLDVTSRITAETQLEAGKESEARQVFVLGLADALRALSDPVRIQAEAARRIGEHLNAGRAYYVEVDEPTGDYVVEREWHRSGESRHTRRYRFEDWPMPWLADGRTWIVRDVSTDPVLPDAHRAAYRDHDIGALIVVPLVKEGSLVATFVTNQDEARDWTANDIRAVEETAERTWAAVERARAAATLHANEERDRAILASALDYGIYTTDCAGLIETWSPGAEAVFGWSVEEAIGQDMKMTFVSEDQASDVSGKERAEARETGYAANIRWHLRKDGRRVFIEGSTRPLRDGHGETRGFLTMGQDVTARKKWEQRQQVLLAELQHRTRNLLAVIYAIFLRTKRGSASVEELGTTFEDRLTALARVQGLLSRLDEGNRITFGELVRAELSAMGAVDAEGQGDRVVLDGPVGVRLRSSTVQTFALAIHELATNALKYGALSQPEGQLSVRWYMVGAGDKPRLRIEWIESGVHMPEPGTEPRGSGYGRELIERALPYQLDARTSFDATADGVHCTIEMPVSESMLAGVLDNA